MTTSGRSQMLATSNFREWHTVVGKIKTYKAWYVGSESEAPDDDG